MKKFFITTIILLIFGISIIISIPSNNANPAVMIQEIQLSPEILMPGDTAVLTIQIKNGESVASQTITLISEEETITTVHTLGVNIEKIWINPATSDGKKIWATSSFTDIGYLAAGSSTEINFELLIDANISEGIYFPTAEIEVSGGTDVRYPILMKVSNSTVDLIKTSIPSKISRAGTTDIVITAVNKRENAVNDVIITPYCDDVEFVPSSYFVGSLDAKTSTEVVFSIKPLKDGEQNLTFDISYKNGDNLHTNSLYVPVTVIQTMDVAPIITHYPISITKDGSSWINIEVYNAKTDKITGVLITPICDATVIPSQYFIGSMDPDDVFSASFNIYADTVDYGKQNIGFIVSYKQDNDYFETPIISKTFEVIAGQGVNYQSSSSSNSQSSKLNGTSSFITCLLPILIVVIFLILIILFYIRRRKRRKTI